MSDKRPYKIIEIEQIEEVPAMNRVVADLLRLGHDEGSLVRRAQDGREPGICVFMIGQRAIQHLAKGLIDFAAQTGVTKSTERLRLKETDSAKWIFEWMEDNKFPWAYGNFDLEGHDVLYVAFIGLDRCRRLARYLSNRGVPTSLT